VKSLTAFEPHVTYRECWNQFATVIGSGVAISTIALLGMAVIPNGTAQLILSVPGVAGLWIMLVGMNLYHHSLNQWQTYYAEWESQIAHEREIDKQSLDIKIGGKNNTVNLNPVNTTNTQSLTFIESQDVPSFIKHFDEFVARAKFLRQIGDPDTTGYERNSYLTPSKPFVFSDGIALSRGEYERMVQIVATLGMNVGRKKGTSGRAIVTPLLDVSPTTEGLELNVPSQPSQANQV
jgi:hypothetical protein